MSASAMQDGNKNRVVPFLSGCAVVDRITDWMTVKLVQKKE